MVVDVEHPTMGIARLLGLPVKFSETPGQVTAPPLLGQHTAEVLGEMGVDDTEMARLEEAEVIARAEMAATR